MIFRFGSSTEKAMNIKISFLIRQLFSFITLRSVTPGNVMSKTTILMKTESRKPSFLQFAWQKICEIVDPYHQKWLWWHGLSERYDMVADIQFDLVIVVKDFRYGLIDKQGNVILRPLYEALDFLKEEALLEGTLPNKRTQLLNLKGKVLYEHSKEACFNHIDGHFLFLDELDTDDKKGKTGIVTSTGKLVIPPKFIQIFGGIYCPPKYSEGIIKI